MSDYPLLGLGGYETYQLAYIATFVAERLARHRQAGTGRIDRAHRAETARDLAAAATALTTATGSPVTGRDLPRPLDAATASAARVLVTDGPRTADVVALTALGEPGFAVVGHVPGVGPVGARVPSGEMAHAVRTHFLTRPAAELTAWAITATEQEIPRLPRQVDLAAVVERLDPDRAADRAVARNLRGRSRRSDLAIHGRFAGVDLDAPPVLRPPESPLVGARPARGTDRAGPRRRATRGIAPRQPRVTAPNTPTTSAGP